MPTLRRFGLLTGRLKRVLADQQVLPEVAFNTALGAALSQDHPRARPLTPALVDQMDLNKSLAFYKERFADASDFTFVFVGSFDLPTIKPLVERYLGSLPALHRKETARDVGIRPPATVVEKQVVKGVEPKSQVGIVFTGPFHEHRDEPPANQHDGGDAERQPASDAARESGRDLRRQRQVGLHVSPRGGTVPRGHQLRLRPGSPGRARQDRLAGDRGIQEHWSIERTDRERSRPRACRDLETNLQENGYLLNRITSKYEHAEDVADVFDPRALYDQLTATAIRDAARLYLNPKRYVQVTLRPEAK